MSSHENYYVPAQSKWPIIATLGMLISVYGVGTWFNDMKAGHPDSHGPLIFFIGTERVTHDVAAKWRATRWWDVDIGDPEIVVWGSPIELGSQDKVRLIRDRLMRTELLPAFEMSDAKVEGFIARIREVRPRMVFGYPSAISHIAGYAEKKGIRLDDLGVKVVFVTSERLYDHQREIISRLFACPVANGYGGQWIRVYPALQLVVAATSRRTPDSAARDQAGTLIQRHVVPALRGL